MDNLDCTYFGNVTQLGDPQLVATADVIVLADAQIGFFVDSSMRYLALQLKCVDEFFLINLRVTDAQSSSRSIIVSNNRSTVLAMKDEVKLPLVIKEGWQFICLDLKDIVQRAFGASYRSCTEIVFSGSCSIWRIYFQENLYADCQLPYHLRAGI